MKHPDIERRVHYAHGLGYIYYRNMSPSSLLIEKVTLSKLDGL